MVWGYLVRKYSQQISIGYNARLAVIILWGPRMDLPSNGYPKRSPGVSNGSLFYALAPYGCKPLFRPPTSNIINSPRSSWQMLSICALARGAVYRDASVYH